MPQGISNHDLNEETFTPKESTRGLNVGARSKSGVRKVVETIDVDSGIGTSKVSRQRIVYRRKK